MADVDDLSQDPAVLITLGSARVMLEEHRTLTRRIVEDTARLAHLKRRIDGMRTLLSDEQWAMVLDEPTETTENRLEIPVSRKPNSLSSLIHKHLEGLDSPTSAHRILQFLKQNEDAEVRRKAYTAAVHVALGFLASKGLVRRVGQAQYIAQNSTALAAQEDPDADR